MWLFLPLLLLPMSMEVHRALARVVALRRPGSGKTASVTSQKSSLFTLPQIILWKTSPNTGHPTGEGRGGKLCLVL